MSKRSAAWDEAIGGVRRSVSFDSFRPAVSMSFRPTVSMSFIPAASMSFRPTASMSKWSVAWGVRQSAVEEKFAWEKERWESDWGDIQQKKKDWGDERVTERETEKDERWARIFIILLTGLIKNSFFFFNGTSKFFPYTSIAAACLLGMWS